MYLHRHLTTGTTAIALMMMMVKLLVAHTIMAAMTIRKASTKFLFRLVRIQLWIIRSLR